MDKRDLKLKTLLKGLISRIVYNSKTNTIQIDLNVHPIDLRKYKKQNPQSTVTNGGKEVLETSKWRERRDLNSRPPA